jgi:hypothetical protein
VRTLSAAPIALPIGFLIRFADYALHCWPYITPFIRATADRCPHLRAVHKV